MNLITSTLTHTRSHTHTHTHTHTMRHTHNSLRRERVKSHEFPVPVLCSDQVL